MADLEACNPSCTASHSTSYSSQYTAVHNISTSPVCSLTDWPKLCKTSHFQLWLPQIKRSQLLVTTAAYRQSWYSLSAQHAATCGQRCGNCRLFSAAFILSKMRAQVTVICVGGRPEPPAGHASYSDDNGSSYFWRVVVVSQLQLQVCCALFIVISVESQQILHLSLPGVPLKLSCLSTSCPKDINCIIKAVPIFCSY